ncbi:MAG TPA: error-prone DNA polymerase [Deltaproteobacteria bacterium]|nr:error-prone DNA polymerase [Deltaproteobacteria bacterium]
MYAELHCHSHFSLLDGASSPERIVEAARHVGLPALALTDHNGLYAAPRFYKTAKSAGIKPIIGAELALEGGFHIVLLVKDATGYTNLCRMITKAQLAGSKGNPLLGFHSLKEYRQGLICLSACQKGEIPGLLLKDDREGALLAARRYVSIFGQDDFFIELQHHLNPDDSLLCKRLIALAQALGVRTVATNNVHYAVRQDSRLQDVLVCIKNRVSLDGSAPFRHANSEYYLKGAAEMCALPRLPPEAMDTTRIIAERCNFDLDFSSYRFPDFHVPNGKTARQYLQELCTEKLPQRYGPDVPEVWTRLEHELELIDEKGLCGYFLIVWDIMEFARKSGILAQGRGSAASSLVAYLLGITPVDPIRHNLFIGRFLNEFAIPDIDVDIATHRREEVLQYVYDKYGREHAAMVCTYVTFKARNAVREVGKVLGLPQHLLDRMAKSLSVYGASHVIRDLKEIPEFRDYLDSEAWGHFCILCEGIADFPRYLSIHVGGMVIASKPVSEIVPVEWARAEGRVVCQWDKDGVDDAGLIKVDLLGLRMLSLISNARDLIEADSGLELDLQEMPMDDPRVYDVISDADTVGVFQVESRAQMQTLPRMRPRSLEDLSVEVAIIRPGPLQGNMVHPYLKRRQGLEPVDYMHPILKPVLEETMGVILYQEQILQVAMLIAGFSAGEGNLLRKVMARKNAREELAKWRGRFVEGARVKGIGEAVANRAFDLIGGFADFGFCKSHAMSFALLCYRSAFLKKYYPAPFYCALLNNQPMGFYVPEVIVGDARRHGIGILPVDINESFWQCSVVKGFKRSDRSDGSARSVGSCKSNSPSEAKAILLGFRYVKEMGEDRAEKILRARVRGGEFVSLRDFCVRSRLDPESTQNLIMVGAFDGIDRSRRHLLWDLGSMQSTGCDGIEFPASSRVALDEMTASEELMVDYAIQGLSPQRQLLEEYRDRLAGIGAIGSGNIPHCRPGEKVKVGGLTICLQVPPTAKGFAFVTLEDEEGLMNVVLKPDVFKQYKQMVRLEPLLVVDGTVQKKDGVLNIIASRVDVL